MAADKVSCEITDKYSITDQGEQVTETWKVWYNVAKAAGDTYASVRKTSAEAAADAGLPSYGSAYNYAPKNYLKVSDISGGHMRGQPNTFKFTIVYSKNPEKEISPEAPAFNQDRFDYTFETFNDVFQKWYESDGVTEKTYKSPAGESYDPISLGRYALSISRSWSSSSSPHGDFKGKIGKVNLSPVTLHGTVYAKGELLLGVPSFNHAEYQTTMGLTEVYYRNTVKYLVHPDAAWKIAIRAQGLFAHPEGFQMPKDTAGNQEDTGMVLAEIWSATENKYVEVGSPVPLDVDGKVVSDLSKASIQEFFYHQVAF